MPIKWENYKIASTALGNQIVIGKVNKKQEVKGLTFFVDKSEDRTKECLLAVMQHMNGSLEEGQTECSYSSTLGKLTWEPIQKGDA
ncbi:MULTISPECIES: DUF7446 family protein [unclassified Psychrobacillus]|uniref:DUF7446 family protein n=1 Tax=unclassified Psychrobacillus TaxID=2636677 RepID=UPI0030F91033